MSYIGRRLLVWDHAEQGWRHVASFRTLRGAQLRASRMIGPIYGWYSKGPGLGGETLETATPKGQARIEGGWCED